jgi:hypothetical protein
MLRIDRVLLGILLAAAAASSHAGSGHNADVPVDLSMPRVSVTLVPDNPDVRPASGLRSNLIDSGSPLRLSLQAPRRKRLEVAINQRDVFAPGDRLQLRLASDAHLVAKLLSRGEFSGAEESMVAFLGFASRLRLSYSNGPWDFSLGATRRLGDGQVKARLTYTVRF